MNILSPAAYNPYVSSSTAAFAQPLFSQPVDNLAPPAGNPQNQSADYGKIHRALDQVQANAQHVSTPEAVSAVKQGSSTPAVLNSAEANLPAGHKRIDVRA